MNTMKPKIVIYGAGYYGLEAARIALAKGWPIVAAVNRAGPKIGQDLGRIADLGRDLGVIIQDCETADYRAMGADIAIVALTDRLKQNLPAYQRLMDAGINIVCHGSESYFAQGADPALAGEIDDRPDARLERRQSTAQKGKYAYALQDYGLSEGIIGEMFAPYISFMNEKFGP
jgi:hypothetical protein